MSVGRILAVIPARAGSKRLPGKNARLLGGAPLFTWTVRAALGCGRLARTIVSTDSAEIAAVAKAAGAEAPFLRPAELASDTADSVSVAKHALKLAEADGGEFDAVMLLQPTSPLRGAREIGEAIELMEAKKATGVISVCEAEHTPLGMNVLPADGSMDGFLPEKIAHKRAQDLPTYYRVNGAIYIVKKMALLEESSFFPRRGAFAYVMDWASSVEIDVESDLVVAEALLRLKLRREGIP